MRRLIEHYRLPEPYQGLTERQNCSGPEGFFQFGQDTVCFGSCATISPAASFGQNLPDILPQVVNSASPSALPFDPDSIIENLLMERYPTGHSRFESKARIRAIYYTLRPMLPVSVRKYLQRAYLSGWVDIGFPQWPVDFSVENMMETLLKLTMLANGVRTVPFIWFWPEGHESCAIVTHDVETQRGRDFCQKLMDLNDSCGIKSSFQIIPERRYDVASEFLVEIRGRGFEINVHDLNHDGNLFLTPGRFKARVSAINEYGRRFQAKGFRAGVMYRNQEWYKELEFEYDMSVPNVAHLEPQRGGCCAVRPYFIDDVLEIPLTTTQDYALFHFLGEYSLDLWLRQIELLRKRNGLISVLVHPDYIIHEREQAIYLGLLNHLQSLRKSENLWIATPNQVNAWWRLRNELQLVQQRNEWRIVGRGSERARVAFAHLEGDALQYHLGTGLDPAVISPLQGSGSLFHAD